MIAFRNAMLTGYFWKKDPNAITFTKNFIPFGTTVTRSPGRPVYYAVVFNFSTHKCSSSLRATLEISCRINSAAFLTIWIQSALPLLCLPHKESTGNFRGALLPAIILGLTRNCMDPCSASTHSSASNFWSLTASPILSFGLVSFSLAQFLFFDFPDLFRQFCPFFLQFSLNRSSSSASDFSGGFRVA